LANLVYNIRMAKKAKIRKRIFRKIAKAHALFSVSLFILYLLLSMVYSPEFLLSDIRSKFRALADDTITITATVLGPPVKPVVTGEAICTVGGDLSVSLDWADDENSQTFSIDRDSLPLITGLIDSQYSDTNVSVGSSYSYVVTALGEMNPGSAVSDPVVVDTPAECEEQLPTPEVMVTDFDGNGLVNGSQGVPETTTRRPTFAGTTNMPNADIILSIPGSSIVSAETTANINGYWSWQPPVNLDTDRQTLFVTATDPLDVSRIATTSFDFLIKEKNEENEKKKSHPGTTQITITPVSPVEIPLDYQLTFRDDSVLPGRELATIITINKLSPAYEGVTANIRYVILDNDGSEKGSFSQSANLHLGAKIGKNIPIAKYFPDGRYKLRAEIIFDKYDISREQSFNVLPLPVLKFGGGTIATYPTLLSQMGTISIWLLIALLIWLILFSREYRLYLRALRHITEQNLIRLGLISMKKRKGVSR
jgi:hypothetical protein